jgi:hypothetical protein
MLTVILFFTLSFQQQVQNRVSLEQMEINLTDSVINSDISHSYTLVSTSKEKIGYFGVSKSKKMACHILAVNQNKHTTSKNVST